MTGVTMMDAFRVMISTFTFDKLLNSNVFFDV